LGPIELMSFMFQFPFRQSDESRRIVAKRAYELPLAGIGHVFPRGFCRKR
jgi:hypothetical protein